MPDQLWNYHLTALLMVVLSGGGCVDFESARPLSPRLTEFSADTLLAHDLQGELFISGEYLEMPTDISIGQRFVYIGDPYADSAVAVFDRDSGDFVANTATKGEGPQEIPHLRSLSFRTGSDSGWVYSQGLAKYLDSASITKKMLRLTGSGAPLDPVWVGGDSIISTGLYETGRLGVYTPTGKFTKTIGDIPGEASVPGSVRQYAYEAIARSNSKGNRIVIASLNTDRIEIFSPSEMLHLIRGPMFHEPLFNIANPDSDGNPQTVIESETTQGYVSIAVNDQHIYALYSGRTRGWVRSQGYFSPPGQTVIVFAWSGTPVGILGLQDGAVQIGVSGDGQFVYAVYRRPTPMVLRYETPALYQTPG